MKKPYIRCKNCNGYYKLKERESLEDFLTCTCGGELEYTDHIPMINNKKSIKEINASIIENTEKKD